MTEDEPIVKKPNTAPIANIKNPSSGKLESIYKNIENEPLIKKIKSAEEELEVIMNIQSVELDIEEAENPNLKNISKLTKLQKDEMKKALLNELKDDFEKLLKIPYGPLGYLVMSESEQILKLYGVNTDDNFFDMVEGSKIRITSPKDKEGFNVEKMIVASGGKRWLGEAGSILNDPAETKQNEQLSSDAIKKIIVSIESMLSNQKNKRKWF